MPICVKTVTMAVNNLVTMGALDESVSTALVLLWLLSCCLIRSHWHHLELLWLHCRQILRSAKCYCLQQAWGTLGWSHDPCWWHHNNHIRVIEPVLTVAAWFDCSDPFVLDDIPIQQQIEVANIYCVYIQHLQHFVNQEHTSLSLVC